MSDNIPFKIQTEIVHFNIQTEIIKRVSDVKSLIRMRSVSKRWKSLIDSSQFIAGYGARKTQPHSLFLRYRKNFKYEYLSVNNDTFKVQQDLAPNVSTLMKQVSELEIIGCSRGLLCLYGYGCWPMFVLWNASIRRSVGIVHHDLTAGIFGFAVCPVTNDPTIVKYSYPWIVEVFTLSSKRWTQIQCSKPCKSVQFHERSHGRSQVVIGSCIYRVSCESIHLRYQYGYYTHQYMVVSFDLNAKEFKFINFPDTITNKSSMPARLFISKLRESLILFVPDRLKVGVWKMEHDCSFTKLFTFNTPERSITKILGFRKNDEVMLEIFRQGEAKQFGSSDSAVEVYEPWSRNMTKFPIYGQCGSFFISSYKETLLLLDHLDSSIYEYDCKAMVLRSDMQSHHCVAPLVKVWKSYRLFFITVLI